MRLILPPGVSAARFEQALAAFAGVVGKEWVLATDEDRDTYVDAYAPGEEASHAPSAAVAPADVAQVQGLLKVANQFHIPLWPMSRGKNFGYGGASPRMPGTVMLDLGRMNRIIEVNEAQGYCIVEPGVGFFDMHDHLQKNRIALQMGTPGNGWGSLMGNALERGFSPAGDHSNNICGLELVLASGEIVRTGMGAMGNGKAWPLFKHGFGPSWDQMIVQSNFAIVTKMCLWMKPEDEAVINIDIKLDKPEELEWFTRAVTPLRLKGVLDGLVRITSYQASATVPTLRSEWYTGPGSIPDDVIETMKARLKVGWWNGNLRLGGYSEVCEANLRIVQAQFANFTKQEFPVRRTPGSVRAGPSTYPLQMVNWYGGRGGHIGFSPAMPADARLVQQQFERTRRRYQEFGLDYSGTFYNDGRSVTNVNLILYGRDDPDMKRRVRELFLALVSDAKQLGYGEYRTHLSYMDDVAESFDFNNHALRTLNERVKDALDPNGVLAPGRNGIWPKELSRPTRKVVSRRRSPAGLLVSAALFVMAAAAGAANAGEDDLIARGKTAFTHRCAMCHREGQTGTFILARRLGKEKSLLEQRTDLQPAYIRQVVRAGLVNMPRLSRVEMPDPDLDAAIAYLMSPKTPSP